MHVHCERRSLQRRNRHRGGGQEGLATRRGHIHPPAGLRAEPAHRQPKRSGFKRTCVRSQFPRSGRVRLDNAAGRDTLRRGSGYRYLSGTAENHRQIGMARRSPERRKRGHILLLGISTVPAITTKWHCGNGAGKLACPTPAVPFLEIVLAGQHFQKILRYHK